MTFNGSWFMHSLIPRPTSILPMTSPLPNGKSIYNSCLNILLLLAYSGIHPATCKWLEDCHLGVESTHARLRQEHAAVTCASGNNTGHHLCCVLGTQQLGLKSCHHTSFILHFSFSSVETFMACRCKIEKKIGNYRLPAIDQSVMRSR